MWDFHVITKDQIKLVREEIYVEIKQNLIKFEDEDQKIPPKYTRVEFISPPTKP